MVLTFEGSLFGAGGLEQDSGRISERWGQEGGENISIIAGWTGASGSVVVYTVTAGKILYITSITIGVVSPVVGSINIFDNVDSKFAITDLAHNAMYTFTFDTPLKFETNLRFVEASTGGSGTFTFVGWEE